MSTDKLSTAPFLQLLVPSAHSTIEPSVPSVVCIFKECLPFFAPAFSFSLVTVIILTVLIQPIDDYK